MKKTLVIIGVCLLSTLSFFSGCVNVPEELTQFSIISFDVEPGIINQGEYANLSWVVISASSVNIDNGIGIVALTGHRIIQPTQTTTYILTASNATTTKSATAVITVKPGKTITDGIGDVSSIDSEGDTVLITYSPEIDVDNLDLIEATYTLQGTQVTLTLQVNGLIQNQGKLIDVNSEDFDMNSTLNYVQYGFNLTTSSDDYNILYVNKTCNFTSNAGSHNLPSSDFSANGNTLTVTFTLTSADETYQSLAITSAFTKINLSVLHDPSSEGDIDKTFIWLTDSAPNPPLADVYAEASNVGSVGETIQFNATVDTTTGQPPYTYHWDFGDQSTSAVLNPTHVYTKAGHYTYTFTVTDNADATASQTGTITIKE